MESISPDELALELLHQCLRGNQYSSELLDALLRLALSPDAGLARKASHALFHTVVESLADLFEPCMVDCYAALFSETIARVIPSLDSTELLERFRRIRNPQPVRWEPRHICVLSRVTLGADIAVTSVLLDAAKKRFPKAGIYFAGPAKNYALFAADPRIRHLAAPYARDGTLSRRLAVFPALRDALSDDHALVIDPDSRLTQLGLLPVCPESRYLFFESRSYGEYGDEPIGLLASLWAAQVFGVEDAANYLAPAEAGPQADITISLGVGGNPSKGLGAEFERLWFEQLASTGARILADRGGSAEEAARVSRAAADLANVETFSGSFAAFAGSIRQSRVYCGYDSAGQHAAAAFGTPLFCLFAGFPSDRFLARWHPFGPGPKHVLPIRNSECDAAAGSLRFVQSHLSQPAADSVAVTPDSP